MRGYIISIAAATVISAVISMLTPQKWEKYVGVVTGLAVTICIGQPIIRILGSNSFDGFTYTAEQHSTEGSKIFRDEVKKELEQRIENDAAERLRTEFDKECNVEVTADVSESGEVRGISSVLIGGDKVDAVVIGRMREVYGAAEVKYVGTEKTAEKAE